MGGGTCGVEEFVASPCSSPPRRRGKEAGGSLSPAPRPRCRSDRSCRWWSQRDTVLRRQKNDSDTEKKNKRMKSKLWLFVNFNTFFVCHCLT